MRDGSIDTDTLFGIIYKPWNGFWTEWHLVFISSKFDCLVFVSEKGWNVLIMNFWEGFHKWRDESKQVPFTTSVIPYVAYVENIIQKVHYERNLFFARCTFFLRHFCFPCTKNLNNSGRLELTSMCSFIKNSF